MKKFIVFICIIALAVMLFMLKDNKNRESVTFEIPQGSGISQIADILKDNGLIKSKLLFINKASKTEGYLMPGKYSIIVGTTTDDIIKILKAGVTANTVTLTIPEGFSVEMIAKRVENLGLCQQSEFLAAVNSLDYNFDFLKDIKPDKNVNYKLQGFLYPNTYYISKTATAKEIVRTLLGEFEKQMKENNIKSDELYKKVTIASLLEREASVESEKPIIAGVIVNRLNQNMLLQIDAAVVYAVTDGQYNVNAVYNNDLSSKSPYNLYKYKGLPPGPICNPSISSVIAAQTPKTHDYLYYRTDDSKNDGSHVFTKTFDEHLNVNKG